MNNYLKCIRCLPPERHEGCHSTCKEYLEWKKEKERISELTKKKKYIEGLGYSEKRKK